MATILHSAALGSLPEAIPPTPRRKLLHLERFLVVTLWGEGAAGIQWVEARHAAQHPVMHRIASDIREFPSLKCQQC